MVLFLFGHVQRHRFLAFLFLPLTRSVKVMFSFLAVAVLCFRRWAGFSFHTFYDCLTFLARITPRMILEEHFLELVNVLSTQLSLDTIEQALSSLLVAFRIARHFRTSTAIRLSFEIRQQRTLYFTPFLITI